MSQTNTTPDNVHGYMKRAGNVNSAVQMDNIPVGLNGLKIAVLTPSDVQTLPRDADNTLGDSGQKHNTGTFISNRHETVVSATGYDIHGQLIVPRASTNVTFSSDEAGDDNARVDNGQYVNRRSNTNTVGDYPLKLG